jgi:hypothetical protein
MKTRTIITAAASVALLLGACSNGTADPAEAEPAEAKTAVQTTVEPTTEAPTTEAPAAEPGTTRDNPIPVGTNFDIKSSDGTKDYNIVLGATNFEATQGIIQEEADAYYSGDTSWVTAPEAGNIILVAHLDGVYNGTEVGLPSSDLSIAYVGPSGQVYDQWAMSAKPINHIDTISEMYAGTPFTGTITQEVPADDAQGGVWRIGEAWSLERNEVFVATTEGA